MVDLETMYTDATCYECEMRYPTDAKPDSQSHSSIVCTLLMFIIYFPIFATMKVEYNKNRVTFLLSLFKMTEGELLSAINVDIKTPITWKDIDSCEIELNHLKRIDRVFNKGLSYYTDPSTPRKDKGVSVFFRKEDFSTELNIGAKKRVREFEDIKTQISAICKLSKFNVKRKLATYAVVDDPRTVAFSLRNTILPEFSAIKREFLKNFINKLGSNNVLVFEFVDTFNKKEKANIDGFYLEPNAIVLKRNQESLSREIFTLAHEVGHYLLQQEEVEEIDFDRIAKNTINVSEVEKWCNNFAYYLLLGEKYADQLDKIAAFDYRIDYGHDLVKSISRATNLSRLAIFTNILLQNKLTFDDYSNIREDLHQQWIDRKEKENLKKELDKEAGIPQRGSTPRPIQSSLVLDIYNCALNRGVVSEMEYCTALRIKANDIRKTFYESSH